MTNEIGVSADFSVFYLIKYKGIYNVIPIYVRIVSYNN